MLILSHLKKKTHAYLIRQNHKFSDNLNFTSHLQNDTQFPLVIYV